MGIIIEEGSYEEAYKLLQELGDYKDSLNKIKEIEDISPSTPSCSQSPHLLMAQLINSSNTKPKQH